jgi:hypothetical protein
VAFAAWPGAAQAAEFRVVVVPSLELADVAARGAVGLLVPGAGPTVSAATARAALVRGKVENSLRGGFPSGPPLLRVEAAPGIPRPPAIVLELPRGGKQDNDRRYPVAVLGRGYRGVLTSESTRIPGLVSIADLAPTALGREDALGWRSESNPVARLAALDRRIRDHSDARLPAMLLAAGLIALLALVVPRAAVVAFATVLGANLALGASGTTALGVVLLTMGLAAVAAVPLAGALAACIHEHKRVPVGLALTAVLGAYLVAFAVDGSWIALSPLGPAQTARFYGLSNLLETLLLVPALAGAAYLRRPLAFTGVATLALVTVAGARFGADGGGAIVLAVGYAVLAVLLSGGRRRALAVALPAAAALVIALVAIDAATGASSHVTRALEDGPGGLAADLADRVTVSWRRATDPWPLAIPVVASILGLTFLVADAIRRRPPERELLYAFAAAIAGSLVVNDSPLEVSLFGLVGFWALAREARAQQRGSANAGRMSHGTPALLGGETPRLSRPA